MIDVRVRQHHGIQGLRIEAETRSVACFLFAPPLAHAAVEKHANASMSFDQVARSGDLLDGAEKAEQSHEKLLFVRLRQACPLCRRLILMHIRESASDAD
jgi:hypothetical protein